jgi:hypothetical protein
LLDDPDAVDDVGIFLGDDSYDHVDIGGVDGAHHDRVGMARKRTQVVDRPRGACEGQHQGFERQGNDVTELRNALYAVSKDLGLCRREMKHEIMLRNTCGLRSLTLIETSNG